MDEISICCFVFQFRGTSICVKKPWPVLHTPHEHLTFVCIIPLQAAAPTPRLPELAATVATCHLKRHPPSPVWCSSPLEGGNGKSHHGDVTPQVVGNHWKWLVLRPRESKTHDPEWPAALMIDSGQHPRAAHVGSEMSEFRYNGWLPATTLGVLAPETLAGLTALLCLFAQQVVGRLKESSSPDQVAQLVGASSRLWVRSPVRAYT